MDLQTEYLNLMSLAATPGGVATIEEAFMKASGHIKCNEGGWIKVEIGSGKKLVGFAFDPVTMSYELGRLGDHHYKARLQLLSRLENSLRGKEVENIEDRLVEGRAAYIPEWQFPLILCWGPYKPAEVEELDRRVLELGIGLPIRALFESSWQLPSSAL